MSEGSPSHRLMPHGSETATQGPGAAVLLAGAARLSITPDRPLELGGYAGREFLSTGVLDPIHARALYVRRGTGGGVGDVCLVALDLIGLPVRYATAVREEVGAACGLPPEQVMLACSHTHAAPSGVDFVDAGRTDPGYLDELRRTIVAAAHAAKERLEPVRVRSGEWEVHLTVNRRDAATRSLPFGPTLAAGRIDPRARVLCFESAAGRPLAVVYHYAMHPVTLRNDNRLISSDFPGVTSAALESCFTGAVALFLNGPAGDLVPRLVGGPPEMRVVGEALAEAVAAALEAAAPVDAGEPGPALGAVRHLTLPAADPGMPAGMEIAVQALRLPGTTLVGLAGEPLLGLGQAIEVGLARRGRRPVWVVGFANGCPGYLPTVEACDQGGYEPVTSARYYNHPVLSHAVQSLVTRAAWDTAQAIGQG